MIQRTIAALRLGTLSWLSMPVALGSPILTMHSVHRHGAAQDHSCCPRTGRTIAPILLTPGEFSGAATWSAASCCAKNGPVSPANIPIEKKATRPSVEQVVTNVVDIPYHAYGLSSMLSTARFLPTPFEQSTVLRI